jgi:hypothetical protein
MAIGNIFSHPIRLVFAIWMFVFAATRIQHGIEGYTAAMKTFQADLKGAQKCLVDPDHRITFSARCEELDSFTSFSPYWSGLKRMRDNTSLCGFDDCGKLMDNWGHALGTIGAMTLFGGVLATICGVILYVVFTRSMQFAGSLPNQSQKGADEKRPAIDLSSIPENVWRQLAYLVGNRALIEQNHQRSQRAPSGRARVGWVESNGNDDDNDNEQH